MQNLLKKLNIDEQISNQILNKYNDDINKINQDLETANKTLDLKNKELTEVNKNIKELQKLDPEKIKEELENTKIKMKELENTHKVELENLKIDNAVNTALLKNGAKNNKAVMPFINKGLVKFDEKGDIVGLDEQLKSIMNSEETKFLFNQKEEPSIKGLDIQSSGATPGNSIGIANNKNYLKQKSFTTNDIPNFNDFLQQYNNTQP